MYWKSSAEIYQKILTKFNHKVLFECFLNILMVLLCKIPLHFRLKFSFIQLQYGLNSNKIRVKRYQNRAEFQSNSILCSCCISRELYLNSTRNPVNSIKKRAFQPYMYWKSSAEIYLKILTKFNHKFLFYCFLNILMVFL